MSASTTDRPSASPLIVILGGYGNAGRLVATGLLKESDARIVVAGRNGEKAQAEALRLNGVFPGERVSACAANAADPDSLRLAFDGAAMIVSTSSTSQHARTVAEGAVEAGADYLDIQLSSPDKLTGLRSLLPAIERAERCFITDGGFHPGLPAALVRLAARRFDAFRHADVGSVIRIDWRGLRFSSETWPEMMQELQTYEPLAFRDGRWVRSWQGVQMDFGPPFGLQPCYPMMLEEMRALPTMYSGLERTGFFVGGFNPVTDYVVLPLAVLLSRITPRHAARLIGPLFEWSLKRFSRPPFGTILRLDAGGTRDGRPASLSLSLGHEDAYFLTAAPVVACLLQWLRGRRPVGLHLQGQFVDVESFFKDLHRMGLPLAEAWRS